MRLRRPVVVLLTTAIALGLVLGFAPGLLGFGVDDSDGFASPDDGRTDDLPDTAPWEDVLTVEVPTGALPDGAEVTVGPSDDDRPPLSVGAWRSPPFTIDADGRQPDRPLLARIPVAGLEEVGDPTLLSLMRWDTTFEVWVPVVTELSSDGTELVAHIDHLSLFRVQEWQVWEDLQRGARLTGRQVKDLYTGTTESLRRTGRRAAEGFEELLRVGQDVTTGWLGIGGADPPSCEELETDFALVFSHDGDERPLYACQESGGHADEVILRVANNRSYGMLLDVPRTAQVRLDDWPELAIDGQAAAFTFYELFESALGIGMMYLPPGAHGRITLDLTELDQTLVAATSTPAYTGFDLAAELLSSIYLDAPELGIDTINCLTRGGRSFIDLVGGPEAQEVGGLFEALRTCAVSLNSDVLLELAGIARSTIATIPALASNLIDTDWSTFSVHVQIRVQRFSEMSRTGPPREVAELLDAFAAEDAACRGGPGDNATNQACNRRADAHEALDDLGWCRNRRSDPPHEPSGWHECDADSWRAENLRRYGTVEEAPNAGDAPGSTIVEQWGPDGPRVPSVPDGPDGSGCSPGADTLPDGVWFGFISDLGEDTVLFDLACLYTGERALRMGADPDGADILVKNDVQSHRAIPVSRSAQFFVHRDHGLDFGSYDRLRFTATEIAALRQHLDQRMGLGLWSEAVGVWIRTEDGNLVEMLEFWFGFVS